MRIGPLSIHVPPVVGPNFGSVQLASDSTAINRLFVWLDLRIIVLELSNSISFLR